MMNRKFYVPDGNVDRLEIQIVGVQNRLCDTTRDELLPLLHGLMNLYEYYLTREAFMEELLYKVEPLKYLREAQLWCVKEYCCR